MDTSHETGTNFQAQSINYSIKEDGAGVHDDSKKFKIEDIFGLTFDLKDLLVKNWSAADLYEADLEDDSQLTELDNNLTGLEGKVEELAKLITGVQESMRILDVNLHKTSYDDVIVLDDDEPVVQDSRAATGHRTQAPRPFSKLSPQRTTGNQVGFKEAETDIIAIQNVKSVRPNLPRIGLYKPPHVVVGTIVYAMKASHYGIWYKGKISEIKSSPGEETQYKVRFEKKSAAQHLSKSGKHIAYGGIPDVLLRVGTRIIAMYSDEAWSQNSSFYAGIIAEPPSLMNKYRYLVFFDDGYAQYISHTDVHVVIEASKDVWEDVHPDSKDFIKNYVSQYPERPMLKIQKGQVIKTEWNGKWWIARVLEVDATLVKMHFDADDRTEWIYRGSTRLGPLFNELANKRANLASGKKIKRHNVMSAGQSRRNTPYIEYTRGQDEEKGQKDAADTERDTELIEHTDCEKVQRINVARKSTATPASVPAPQLSPSVTEQNRKSGAGVEDEGFMQYNDKEKHAGKTGFIAHRCRSLCLVGCNEDPAVHIGKNPLAIPLCCGWERQLCKRRTSGKKTIMYMAPCGRRLRTIEEAYHYLVITNSKLSIDLFCFDSFVHCYGEFVPAKVMTYIKDVSYGKETVPVSCVNSLDQEYPTYVEYSTRRIPADGVKLNLDPEFLTCCDCTDNCDVADRCECRQMTINATGAHSGGLDPSAGYYYRRLNEQAVTGIYECNARCRCNSRCLNRVAQNGLRARLQVFKTERRGWGIRCLNDIACGSFICTYAGLLLTDEGANVEGKQYGDEYLAELDYIEVVEQMKEGYEAEVVDSESEEGDNKPASTRLSEEDESFSDYKNKYSDLEQETGINVESKERSTRRSSRKLSQGDEERENSMMTRSRNSSVSGQLHRSLSLTDKERHTDRNTKDKSDSIGAENKKRSSSSKTAMKPARAHKSFSAQTPRKKSQPPQPSINLNEDEDEEQSKYKSVRTYFDDELCYIMDAKSIGNIGRYLNHCCTPNVFVQNVFVDTHDLRFPWVAFFAQQYIRAGTELTWDYNYDVGSVPEKVMWCHCNSTECRGRLL